MRRVAMVAALLSLAAPASASAPARLFISAKEFALITSRQALTPGRATIQLYNAGEDAHDLKLQRVGGTKTLSLAETAPGRVTQISATLRSGTWKLWCSLPGHRQAGMHATLVVRP